MKHVLKVKNYFQSYEQVHEKVHWNQCQSHPERKNSGVLPPFENDNTNALQCAMGALCTKEDRTIN